MYSPAAAKARGKVERRAIGFFSDEVDALLDALGKFREIAPPRKPAVPDRTTDNKKKKTTARKRAA